MSLDLFYKAVHDYQNAVTQAIALVESHYGVDILEGFHAGIIPRTSMIGEAELTFHGIGCWVAKDNLWVDWDFPLRDGIVGIDPWKLYTFTQEMPEVYGEYSTIEPIQAAIQQLCAEGVMEKGGLSNQYFFK
jgi:hypothetical protein